MPRQKKIAPLHRSPGTGRVYEMGPLRAIFKADGEETRGRYSISEWWLDPYTRGPGAHQHEEDDIFYVLEGTMSFFVGGEWIDAPKGSLVIAPGGTPHDFENRTADPAGALNFSVPGDFEREMAGIAEWFRARSAADARTANAPRESKPAKKTKGKTATTSPAKPSAQARTSGDDRWWSFIERSRKGTQAGEEQAERLVQLLSDDFPRTKSSLSIRSCKSAFAMHFGPIFGRSRIS